jgi:hypothetical protein
MAYACVGLLLVLSVHQDVELEHDQKPRPWKL